MDPFPCYIKMSSGKDILGKNHSAVVNALSLELRSSFLHFPKQLSSSNGNVLKFLVLPRDIQTGSFRIKSGSFSLAVTMFNPCRYI
jgi:hypothetical protein